MISIQPGSTYTDGGLPTGTQSGSYPSGNQTAAARNMPYGNGQDGAWSGGGANMNPAGSAKNANPQNGSWGSGAATVMDVAPAGAPNAAATYYPEAADGLTSIRPDLFDDHMSADEAAKHSWRALLARNVGRNVIANFLLGTQNTVSVEGQLYEVGSDYIVIYQPAWNSHITADLYSVKFVEFREPPNGD